MKRNHTSKTISTLLLLLFDFLTVSVSFYLALLVRFDFKYSQIESAYIDKLPAVCIVASVVAISVYFLCQLYNMIWNYFSVNEIGRLSIAVIVSNFAIVSVTWAVFGRYPWSVYCMSFMMQFIFALLSRGSFRIVNFIRSSFRVKIHRGELINTMVIGAGNAGRMVVNEYRNNFALTMNPVCIIDDNHAKLGCYIDGVPVIGDRTAILQAVKKYDIKQIVFAITNISAEDKRNILNVCKSTNCTLKILPSIEKMVTGEVTAGSIRDVKVEDLLGRDLIKVNVDEILDELSGKVIMVTGGGGSIGSELCRQIASHNPKRLIIVDIYENNAYDIQQELIRKYPDLDLHAIIASVRDTRRMDSIFNEYRPQIVYHAAAHKHVPLMETSPNEAIKNNVFGTFKTASCAIKYQAEKFVLISTDKAVNPTNIMGASKRLCEMIVQTFDKTSETEFVAVRFGNVLGSNGSVIPLFKRQIEEGGPVTVTHPDIIRYFMTIPEAVSLVLQAGASATGGEIFVLDMGEPVKIVDLAKNMIKLSGFEPDVDIKIEYTGLRPGEKLFEELLMDEEGLRSTDNKLIYVGQPIEFDEEHFFSRLEELRVAVEDDNLPVREIISELVPTYINPDKKDK
ncbi:MAG: polysaccharide biosynthesis protein [Clostridia bacterium]|nr:polysaccharide biosynthesis protein [Clostridia bacterium]